MCSPAQTLLLHYNREPLRCEKVGSHYISYVNPQARNACFLGGAPAVRIASWRVWWHCCTRVSLAPVSRQAWRVT
jgi:hypothetical protein